MRSACQFLVMILVAACASRQTPPTAENAPTGYPPTEVVLRNTSWEDPELAAKELGRLEVIVRVADRPAQMIQNAYVLVKLAGDNPWKEKRTDQRGFALFDSTLIGNYDITVRAIGYGTAKGRITVSRGCRSDVEAYIGLAAIGISPPPPEPGRIRLTTCRVPQR